MALLDARCPSCGAALKVNGGLDAANCEFCGAAFIVEKAVQNFYVNITVQGQPQSDFEIRGGVLMKYNGSAAEVVVPDGVIEIGHAAFERCINLKRVILPDGLQIISYAFAGCVSLEYITIPSSVTEIHRLAFNDCSKLSCIVTPFVVSGNPGENNAPESYYAALRRTPWYADLSTERFIQRKNQVEQWRKEGLCPCFGGEIGKRNKCTSCGQKS